jgi:ubiquinone/menaquinone biosynthesis C-methylase UbiE
MAQAVGPSGVVFASDLQPEMLEMLQREVDAAGLTNVKTVRAHVGDPGLPPATCDLILLVDVYHEFADPERSLAAMRRALTPAGRIALVEYREEDPAVPIRPRHKMSKTQIRAEYLPRGFDIVREFDGLPWQHLMFFARTGADPAPLRGATKP